jgi:elongation factor G
VRDALERGSLGFPVVDVGVVLVDGGYHAVDSSEFAFRAAGRLGVNEALPNCNPVLLEPIDRLTIYAPSSATSRITSAISGRRGQILGFDSRDGWPGWDQIEVYLPRSERHDLILELRSLTQGLATYEAEPDHLTELSGRLADEVAQQARAM